MFLALSRKVFSLPKFIVRLVMLAVILLASMQIFRVAVQAAPVMQVESVQLVNSPVIRDLDAQIEAVQQATVSALVSGIIIDIPVDVDDYVEKNGVILKFRDTDIRASFDSATAKVKVAQLKHDRLKDIFKKKLVSKSALDQSEATLKSALAKLEQAQEALENTVVRAPYAGIVVKRHVEVGEMARIGTKLMTGLSLEKLRATAQIPQQIIHEVRQRKTAWIYVGKNKDQRVAVSSMSISPYADPVTHTFLVQLYLPLGEHQIYPGMYTKVSFSIDEKDSLVIPKKAIAFRSEVTAVYVRNKNGSLSFRQIRLGHDIDEDQIEVASGLSQGETILLDPVQAAVLIKTQYKN